MCDIYICACNAVNIQIMATNSQSSVRPPCSCSCSSCLTYLLSVVIFCFYFEMNTELQHVKSSILCRLWYNFTYEEYHKTQCFPNIVLIHDGYVKLVDFFQSPLFSKLNLVHISLPNIALFRWWNNWCRTTIDRLLSLIEY